MAHLPQVSLFYRDVGRGEPLFVLHGGLGSDHTYLRALDEVAADARLVYFDHRGNGRSELVPEADITFDHLCADIDALADHLGIEHFGLVGQSFGGYVALEYALRRSERLRRLVLLDTAPRACRERELAAVLATLRARMPELTEALESEWADDDAGVARQAGEITPIFFHRYEPERVAPHYREVRWRAGALRAGMRILDGWDRTPDLHRIRVPTLVMAGRHDIIIPSAFSRIMASRIPGATLRLFAASAHNAFIEEPQAFFRELRSWLRATSTEAVLRPCGS